MSSVVYDVVIIGAGASGLTAAIHAARAGASVLIIEKTDDAGKKLSMTGNGRCNLGNMSLSPECYNDTAQMFVPHYFKRFGLSETLAFFESLGVVVQDEDGYLYPISGQATSVVNALKSECTRLRVKTLYSAQMKAVTPSGDGGGFLVKVSTGSSFQAQSVILSSGALSGTKKCGATGDAYYILEEKGVKLSSRYPALMPLITTDETLPDKTGVRALATIRFQTSRYDLAAEYGEVQFTRGMLSGIPVLQASAVVAKALSKGEEVLARVDLFPAYEDEDFEALVRKVCDSKNGGGREGVSLIEFLEGFHNRYLNEMVLRKMKLSTTMSMKNIPTQMLESILRQYRKVMIPVSGVASYEKAQATAGGVVFSEVDENLQLNRVPGVYVTGELMDVDGRCGGYNLQWAWTSGAIAGMAAAKRVKG